MRNRLMLRIGPSRSPHPACRRPKRNRSTPVGAFPRCAGACRGNAFFLATPPPFFPWRGI